MKTFSKLYKKTSTGALQEWTIIVDGNSITTRFGQTGGRIQTSEPTFCEGKNVGRINATTAEEQALLEAQSQWEKKLKRSGYVTTPDGAMAGGESEMIQGGRWPMLAEHYKDHPAKVQWPAYAQRKYNGHRCIARIDESGRATLWSRKRNPIVTVPHIVAALSGLGLRDVWFDGELYDFDFVRDNGLEEFNHLVKRGSPIPGHEVAKYHVYDAPIEGMTQVERFGYLDQMLGKNPPLPILRAETRLVASIEEAMAFLQEAMDDEFEGIMLRNRLGAYKSHPTGRSTDLLKLKGYDGKSEDAEFKCVGVKEGKKGKMRGKAILQCVTDKGVPFSAKPTGPLNQLKDWWDHPEKVIGKMVTVAFQGWTNEGAPWFPRALQVREDL